MTHSCDAGTLSKWAGEAFLASFRLEMQLAKLPIDAAMINPGFIKPTALMAGGKVLLEKTYAKMPAAAKDTYMWMQDR